MRRVVLALCATFAFGCENSAVSGFEAIQKASCEGDAAAVFERMDMKAFREQAMKNAAESTEGGELEGAMKELAEKAFTQVVDDMRDDIAKGRSSAFCASKMDEVSGGDTVWWTTASGKSKQGRFEKRDVGWVMIRMQDAD